MVQFSEELAVNAYRASFKRMARLHTTKPLKRMRIRYDFPVRTQHVAVDWNRVSRAVAKIIVLVSGKGRTDTV